MAKDNCKHSFKPFANNHPGSHFCEKEQHQCNERCPECKGFCQLNYGHAGKHQTTNHKNKEFNIFVSKKKISTIKIETKGHIRTYKVGESCQPEVCTESCSRKGRAHYHLKPCPSLKGEPCPAEINPKVKHSTDKYQPFVEETFDLWLCSAYWESFDWEMPLSETKVSEVSGCNYYCDHKDHLSDPSYCVKQAWHEEDHEFSCVHEDYATLKNVDIVFCVDTTGSMGSYITQSKNTIREIINKFKLKKLDKDIRFGFVGYRDHPPQDSTYVTIHRDLCSGSQLESYISSVTADGGGDGPEAVLDGLHDCTTKMSWRPDSLKIVIHIADAPPHGKRFVSSGDGFPGGCPKGLTIDTIAERFNTMKIKYKLMKIGTYPNSMADVFRGYFDDYECSELSSALELIHKVPERIIKHFETSEIDMIKK